MLIGFVTNDKGEHPSALAKPLEDVGCERIIVAEHSHHLQVLRATTAAMRRGDTLVVPSLATLKQPTDGFVDFVLNLVSSGLRVRALQEKFDTDGTASVVATLHLLSQLKRGKGGDGKG